jgi:monoamine oxidase
MASKPNIIIIGAGMAGLAAATTLRANNYEVIILEARDRIGGRTWTDYSLGVPFDLGAFIIHGTENNPITSLAHQFNANYTSLKSPPVFINLKQQIPSTQVELIDQQFDALLDDASEYALRAPTDISLAQAMGILKTDKKYSALTTEIYAWKFSFLTLYTGTDPEFLSARHWNRDEIFLGGGHQLMLNGYQPIVEGLAQNIRIILNTKVHKIQYRNAGVKIETNNGSYQADAVIVTLPLGVLKKGEIEFAPSLPLAKTAAINSLDMALLNKIILKFPNIFWQPDDAELRYLTKSYPTFSRIMNGYYYFKQPILICPIGGNAAREFEKMGIEEVNHEIMSLLRHWYGNDIPNPTASLATRWGHDPYSYGSYSSIPVGASGMDYDVLAEPVDHKIFFAGEATNRFFPGTVHGAYLSGTREAELIINNL